MKKKLLYTFAIVCFLILPFLYAGSGVIRPFITRFTSLVDTPSSYSSQASKIVAVNVGATAVEFVTESVFEDGGASEIAVTAGMMNVGTNASATTYWRGDNTWVTPSGSGDLLADGSVPLTANWDVGAYSIIALRFVSDQATGTAPFTVASTTEVANLKAATATLAATVTTNANLTGDVTSTGNATDITQSVLEDGGTDELAITAGMMNTGTNASASTYWRGDNTWVTPGGSGDMTKAVYDVSDDGFVDGNDVAYASTWNADVNAPSMNVIYDYLHNFDADDDGSFADETWLTGAYQPLEATLTDIADGTIAEDLVNTAYPWADNEVSDTLTSSTCTGNAATVTNATLTTALTVDTGTVTLTGNVANSSVLTLGAGASSVSGANTGDNTVATSGDSATAFFGAGTIEHEYGGLQADVSGWVGLFGITGADTSIAVDTFAELDTAIADKALVNKADGAVWLSNHDFGGADLEVPQASPGVPDADGEIEMDFTDGKLIMQHGSAHAELAGATDVAMGSLIKSWSGTIMAPDGVNDVITVKAVNSIEYPHGVVITAVYLGIASNTTYTLTVQNFDDFDTINAANGTIDAVTYTADTTGEIIDTTPTYATIAAGQIIMISIPATDVDWIHFEIYYYEPAA